MAHGPTFVFPAAFTLVLNKSDYQILEERLFHDQLAIQTLLHTLTDGIMYGFKELLSAHEGSVFATSPTGMEAASTSEFNHVFSHTSSQVRIESRGLLFAFNSTTTASFDQWTDLVVNYFRSITTSAMYRHLVSHDTFHVRALCCHYCRFVLENVRQVILRIDLYPCV
jgi:hypothetical protein